MWGWPAYDTGHFGHLPRAGSRDCSCTQIVGLDAITAHVLFLLRELINMNAAHLACARRNQRRLRARKSSASRHLTFQPLESRNLLAGLGDWAVLDLRSALTEGTTLEFKDLSGVVFHGDQVAVTANVQRTVRDLEGQAGPGGRGSRRAHGASG